MPKKFDYEKYCKEYAVLNAKKNKIDSEMKKLKEKITAAMKEEGLPSISNQYLSAFSVSPSSSDSVNLKVIKENNPMIYDILEANNCIETSYKKGSISFKCKPIIL